MDVWSIIQMVVGGGFVAGVVELGTWLRNRKADKVKAQDASLQAVETREFAQVPIKAGYVTTYSGTFFITFDMGFTFEVGDWGNYGSYTY